MIYTDGAHLVADSLDELHQFAKSLGLRREWFQDEGLPHYDLTTQRMASKARAHGANLVTTREIVMMARRLASKPAFD